jgi:hypothetical protein
MNESAKLSLCDGISQCGEAVGEEQLSDSEQLFLSKLVFDIQRPVYQLCSTTIELYFFECSCESFDK